jgi:hypothetical protein
VHAALFPSSNVQECCGGLRFLLQVLIKKTAFFLCALLLTCANAGAGQEPQAPAEEGAANPLATLNEQVKQVLAGANVPFTQEQERAIALMMEERRRATEELFGDLFDFRAGPTEGEDEDRLRSAIDWMRAEFLKSLAEYLSDAQNAVWSGHQAAVAASAATDRTGTRGTSLETQYVRINNNSFTSENNGYDAGGGGTDVIPRGGAGAWHGNTEFLLKDDALNARNAFAGNKPPYQERQLGFDVSGPSIPGRLTTAAEFEQSNAENVGTIRATLPEGIFALGITRPRVSRGFEIENTYQLAAAHSIEVSVGRGSETSRDEGIGGFTLPERRSDSFYREWDTDVYAFSTLSSRSIHETRLSYNVSSGEVVPFSEAIRINVLDAFNSGGAQNRIEESNRTIEFGNLFTRLGERLTIKAGIEGAHRLQRSVSMNNFGGTFTFSSLEAYLAGVPSTYRVTRGNPAFDHGQLEMAGFFQGDVQVNSRLMAMFGVRYEAQQHLDDYDNLDPRVSVAYSPGPDTVIRAGGGIFHSRLTSSTVANQRRFDGTQQFEIVIDNPSYPEPFGAGTLRQSLPSVRVTDPALVAPYVFATMVSLERTFFSNLLFTATWDRVREYDRLRTRNLNTPYDARFEPAQACTAETPSDLCVKPDPTRGNVISLESAGNDIKHTLRLSVRKRFSIFRGTLNYTGQHVRGDVQGGPGTLLTNAYDVQADWGRSPQPVHNVRASLNASLPLGVFVSGEMDYNSGRFYTITTGRDDNRDSSLTDRPVGGIPNSERGPRYLNFDFNISKAFFLRRGSGNSGVNVNVFANMTNAFNHVHLGTPSGVMTSPNFRLITSASDPREIEAGVRFQF